MKKLSADQSACNSYGQGIKLCEGCIRNIGFYSSTHKLWSRFDREVDSDGALTCAGFKPKEDK